MCIVQGVQYALYKVWGKQKHTIKKICKQGAWSNINITINVNLKIPELWSQDVRTGCVGGVPILISGGGGGEGGGEGGSEVFFLC